MAVDDLDFAGVPRPKFEADTPRPVHRHRPGASQRRSYRFALDKEGGRAPSSLLAHWPDRPTSDGEPVAFGALSEPQRGELTTWVTAQRQAIAVAYGFQDAGDLAAFEAGLFGLASDVVVHDPLTVGGEPCGPERCDFNRQARRAEALGPAWSVVRDYAPGAAKAAALSRLARFMADSSPGIGSEQVTGSYGVSGEGGASSSVQRSTTCGRSDRPLHQSGAAAVLARWRTIRAGAAG